MKLTRYGMSWEGDIVPSPHGDFYAARDVLRLEDELDALRNRLRAIEAEQDDWLAVARGSFESVQVDASVLEAMAKAEAKKFGFCDPLEAQAFLAGKARSVVVHRRKSSLRCFPVLFTEQPSTMIRPKVGKIVNTECGRGTVVFHPKQGIVIRKEDGTCATARAWSYEL